MLMSSFAQDEDTSTADPVMSSANSITFKCTVCTINAEDGRYLFTKSTAIETGLLDQSTLFLSAADHGRTKDVFGVSHFSWLLL